MINWQRVTLPLFTYAEFSLKDPALVFADGWFHLVCSVFADDNTCRLGSWRSRNLATWEGPEWLWGEGASGYCSPDIIQCNDQYIMTFQSWDAIHPRQSRNQLFYASSADAVNWTAPRPLAANLTTDLRAIDPALAYDDGHWRLLYKAAQEPRLATAPALDGPWTALPAPAFGWAENGQFVRIDNCWHLLATITDHQQALAALSGLAGDGQGVQDWSQWGPWKECRTPLRSGFNSALPANASALWDGREFDGYWYRVFCAADIPPRGNRDYQLGIARSRDLVTWELPPG